MEKTIGRPPCGCKFAEKGGRPASGLPPYPDQYSLKQGVEVADDGVAALVDHHHDIVAVGHDAGVVLPGVDGAGIPGAPLHLSVDAALEDGLHLVHITAVGDLYQDDLAGIHGHHIDVGQALFRGDVEQSGVDVGGQLRIGQRNHAELIFAALRGIKSGQVHLSGSGGLRGAGAAAVSAAGAGAAAGRGFALLPAAPDDAGGGQVAGGDCDLGGAGGHGGHLAVLVHGGNLLIAGGEGDLLAGGLDGGLQGVAGACGEQGEVVGVQRERGLGLGLICHLIPGDLLGGASVGSGLLRSGAVGQGAVRGGGVRLGLVLRLAGGDASVGLRGTAVRAASSSAGGQQGGGQGQGQQQGVGTTFHNIKLL